MVGTQQVEKAPAHPEAHFRMFEIGAQTAHDLEQQLAFAMIQIQLAAPPWSLHSTHVFAPPGVSPWNDPAAVCR